MEELTTLGSDPHVQYHDQVASRVSTGLTRDQASTFCKVDGP
jgi:hypothetical protein